MLCKIFTFLVLMQVNNAAVTGGKLLDGDALLRKVGLLIFSFFKYIFLS